MSAWPEARKSHSINCRAKLNLFPAAGPRNSGPGYRDLDFGIHELYIPAALARPNDPAKVVARIIAAGTTGTQALFIFGSATHLFHRSRFLTDNRCRTLGYVLLRRSAWIIHAMRGMG
jgi:hypothetical protein